MPQNLYKTFRDEIIKIIDALVQEKKLKAGLDTSKVTVDPPRESTHGDLATNVAMVLAKEANLSPRDLAQLVEEKLKNNSFVTHIEIAGPGFINFSLHHDFWAQEVRNILKSGINYGDSTLGKGHAINVEYASVNPTGPLHMGHSRVALVADVLANLLEKAGHPIQREYYVNDSGGQARILVLSVYQRYLEALGHTIGPIDGYQGDYLIPVGQALAKKYGDQWVNKPEEQWYETFRAFSIDAMMTRIKSDLNDLGVFHDVFTSEHSIVKEGKVEAAFKALENLGLIYQGILEPPKGKTPDDWEPREQTLFRAAQFGDDVDRPLKKSDGSWTYFANDIAYHFDKFNRGSLTLIDVLGADHGGYVKRLSAAVTAITEGKGQAIVKLCQMVRFIDQGQVLKMSKRAGVFVTVQEAIQKVGRDAIRFIMLTRKNDAPLDFDFDKVIEQTKDNPVFYVQYAHARCHSVKRHFLGTFPHVDLTPETLASLDLKSQFQDPGELSLIKLMATWPRVIETAALTYEPHRVAFYLYDVASAFHSLWNKGRENEELRFILPNDVELSQKRYCLVYAVMLIIASGLKVLGVQPLEEMR